MTKPAWKILRDALTDSGMTQVELAERSGLSTKHVNGVILGKNRFSVEVAVRLECALHLVGLTAEELLIAQVRCEIADYVKRSYPLMEVEP